jgi:ketosteroid isomerase-like protein
MSDVDTAVQRFKKAVEAGDMQSLTSGLDDLASDDLVQEWPQSGERIRGKANLKRINENYSAATGTNPKAKLRRISGEGDIRTIEMTIDYGDGKPVSYVGIAEFKNGKLAKMTEYFANPFEAPAWRADFVEKMEPVAVR